MTKTSKNKLAYNTAYNKAHCKQFNLCLNLKTDSDIISKLLLVDNIQGYIKSLIRKDIDSTLKA